MTKELSPLAKLAAGGGVESDETELRAEAAKLRRRMARRLGEAKTQQIFKEVAGVKRGRKAGEKTYDLSLLIALFDAIRLDPQYQSETDFHIRKEIAAIAHEKDPGRYGLSSGAIIASLRRALEARADQIREDQSDWDEHMAAYTRRQTMLALLQRDTKSPELPSGTHKDGQKSTLQSID